jgi:hypothetical protein
VGGQVRQPEGVHQLHVEGGEGLNEKDAHPRSVAGGSTPAP